MNLKPILPEDKSFQHNGKQLVLALRADELEGIVQVFCGEKKSDSDFDSKIALGFFEEDFKDFNAGIVSVLSNLNREIAQNYGAFTGGQQSELRRLVNQILAFIDSDCVFDTDVGWKIK